MTFLYKSLTQLPHPQVSRTRTPPGQHRLPLPYHHPLHRSRPHRRSIRHQPPRNHLQICRLLPIRTHQRRQSHHGQPLLPKSTISHLVPQLKRRFIFFFDWLLDTPDLKSMIISIVVGHTIFFFLRVYPNLHYSKGKRPLDSPDLLYSVFQLA